MPSYLYDEDSKRSFVETAPGEGKWHGLYADYDELEAGKNSTYRACPTCGNVTAAPHAKSLKKVTVGGKSQRKSKSVKGNMGD